MAFLVFRKIIRKKKPKRQFWYKIVKWFEEFFHHTIYLRFLIESCMYIFMSCMLEFSQFESAQGHGFSYTLALFGFLATFAFVLIPIHYFKYRKEGTIETTYMTEVYDGLNDTTWSKLYMPMFILRRFLMAFVIVFMRDSGIWERCIFFTLIQIIAL